MALTACGRQAESVIRTDLRGVTTCGTCLKKLEARQDVPGGRPAPAVTGAPARDCGRCGAQMLKGPGGEYCPRCTREAAEVVASSAPPSRSEAEARPPATVEASTAGVRFVPGKCLGAPCEREARTVGQHRVDCPAGSLVGQLVDVDPVGSLSDGLSSLPAEVRPCCPDAGDDSGRCHGQPFGACRCYACLRLERRLLPAIVRDVAHTFQAAALPMAEKRYRRRQFARLVAQLRGRAQAAERRLEWAEAVVAGQAADLSRLTAELVAAQNGRDDALMQASAAAERASVAEREAAAACERASRYEESRDEAEKRVEELEEELSALRERGRVVRPEAGDWTEEEAAASERMVRQVERATGRKPEGES